MLIPPRFSLDEVDPSLLGAGLADAFQRFSAELLGLEIPGLRAYPAAGKDGGIDLRADGQTQTVVECKVVGTDGGQHVLDRWRITAKALRRNLRDPAGPPRGQAQYAPWFDAARPVRRYVVSTTGAFLNPAREDAFRDEVRRLFDELAAFSHLAHLRGLTVEVHDWSELWRRTPPYLRLRWFRRFRPTHLLPLHSRFRGARFREYLSGERLPYYSRGEHLALHPAPPGIEIGDESRLLARLEHPDCHGMLISGSGGVGKTRLSLELAWRALDAGWTVLRASERINIDAVIELARDLTPSDRVVVLFDYVETQPSFPDIAAALSDLNEAYGLRLRYVANCRTSYATTFQALHEYDQVDLTPPPGDAAREWLRSYRAATVQRILSKTGLDAEAYRAACRDVPVLAVFFRWLAEQKPEAEFEALLNHPDIGSWVLASVRRSFPAAAGTAPPASLADRDLALLMAMLPIPGGAFDRLPPARFGPLRDRLATDVWIERTAEGPGAPEHWATIHDVLADQVLLAFVRTIPYTVHEFVREVLRTAAGAGAVEPAFVALQRVAHAPEFRDVPWARTFRAEMEHAPAAWRAVRSLVLRSGLVSQAERVGLLGATPEVWAEAAADPLYQLAVGLLCRWATREPPDALSAEGRATLIRAALAAGQAVDRSNFVLTYGLRLSPALREEARNWLWSFPEQFQTHYLLVAWLECGHGVDEVRHVVEGWCRRFPLSSQLSYVAPAWLKAGGEPSLVENPIRRWLREYAVDEAARFVYTAWLVAGGDSALLEEPLRLWLANHALHADAYFVYTNWMEAGGAPAVVRRAIQVWLTVHAEHPNARFVYRSWSNAYGGGPFIREAVSRWLDRYGTDLEASYLYSKWVGELWDLAPVKASVLAWLAKHATEPDATFVYKSWLDARGDPALIEEPVRRWLAIHGAANDASYVYCGWLKAFGDFSVVEEPIQHWLRDRAGDADTRFVYDAWLEGYGDPVLLEEPIRLWLAAHGTADDVYVLCTLWLQAGGNPEIVRDQVLGFVNRSPLSDDADHLYREWLHAGGDPEAVRKPLIQWFKHHLEFRRARNVVPEIARFPALSLDTVRDVLAWCPRFPQQVESLWALARIAAHFRAPELAEDALVACEAVIPEACARGKSLPKSLRVPLCGMFLQLIGNPALVESPLRERVNALLAGWLRHPSSFGPDLDTPRILQNRRLLHRVAELLDTGILHLHDDHAALRRFAAWVGCWPSTGRARLTEADQALLVRIERSPAAA